MLWAAVGVWETREGIWAIWMWFVRSNDNIRLSVITGLGDGTLVGHVEDRGGCAAILLLGLRLRLLQLLWLLLLLLDSAGQGEQRLCERGAWVEIETRVREGSHGPLFALLDGLWVEEAVEAGHGGRWLERGRRGGCDRGKEDMENVWS